MLKVTQHVCATSWPTAVMSAYHAMPRSLALREGCCLRGFLPAPHTWAPEAQPALLWSFSSSPYRTPAILPEVECLDGGADVLTPALVPIPGSRVGAGYLGKSVVKKKKNPGLSSPSPGEHLSLMRWVQELPRNHKLPSHGGSETNFSRKQKVLPSELCSTRTRSG